MPDRIAFRSTVAPVGTRRLGGLAVPYDAIGTASDGTRWRIEPGSLEWPDDVPVFTEHDHLRIVGRITGTEVGEAGEHVTAAIVRTAAGDEALELAAEGLRAGWSVGLDVTDSELEADGVRVLRAGTVREMSIVRAPGFSGATVTDIAASHPEGEPVTTPTEPAPVPDPGPVPDPEPDEVRPAQLSAPVVIAPPVPVGFAAPAVIRAEPLDYLRPDAAFSFVRDAFAARLGDDGALARLRRFGRQAQDLRIFSDSPRTAEFVGQDRAGSAQLFPATGYKGDLFVNVPDAPRPINDALSHASISDATPFLVPRFASSTGLVGNHVEGTNPAAGTIVFDTITVTPKAKSGIFDATRELVDSSAAGVAIDTIATNAMRQAYATATEVDAATALTAAGAGVDTAAGTGGAALLEAAIRTRLAAFPSRKLPVANTVLSASTHYLLLVGANRTDGTPLMPYLAYGSVNIAGGTASTGGATSVIAGVPTEPAYALTAVTVLVLRSSAYSFESPTQSWRWEEVLGPAAIRFALFGYYAAAVLRKDGVDRITGTIAMADDQNEALYATPELDAENAGVRADDEGGTETGATKRGK